MSGLRLGSAAVERFAAALDGTVGDAELPAALGELVTITERVAALPRPVMDPAASARIRQRLVSVAAVQAAGGELATATPPRAISWRVRRLATVAVGSVAGITAVAGVAVGAAQSLPGDPFYGIKRAVEGLQLDLAGSPADKGKRELEFASTRLRELRAIGIRDAHAPALLRDMRSELAGAKIDLTTAARTEHSRAPLAEFETAARQQVDGLLALARSAPGNLLPQLQGTVTQISKLSRSVQHVGSTLPPLSPTPPSGGTSSPAGPPTGHPSGRPRPSSAPAAPSSQAPTGRRTSAPASSAPVHRSTGNPLSSLLPSGNPSLPSLPVHTKTKKPIRSVISSLVPTGLGGLLHGLHTDSRR